MKGKSSGSSSILSEYFSLQLKYQAQHGPKTVILMQKGVFYEVYEYDSDFDLSDCDDKRSSSQFPAGSCGQARTVSRVLNMNLTSADKSKPHSRENPFMMGFPCMKLEQHASILLEAGFILVKYEEDPTWKKVKGETVPRQVTGIVSPGTNTYTSGLTSTNSSLTSASVVQLYIENASSKITTPELTQIACGISWLDVNTGKSMVDEVYSKYSDTEYAVQEIYKFLVTKQPREILINLVSFQASFVQKYADYLKIALELKRFLSVRIRTTETKIDFLRIDYQHHFFCKLFDFSVIKMIPTSSTPTPTPSSSSTPSSTPTSSSYTISKTVPNVKAKLNIQKKSDSTQTTSVQTTSVPTTSVPTTFTTTIVSRTIKNAIEELNLERMHYGRISYILLLDHCYQHNETIVRRLSFPETGKDKDKYLVLAHNAVLQLNLLPKPQTQNAFGGNLSSRCQTDLSDTDVDSVLNAVNFVSTTVGSLLLKQRLTTPFNRPIDIERSLDSICELIQHPRLIDKITTSFRSIRNIHIYHRKIKQSELKPRDLGILMREYDVIFQIYNDVKAIQPKALLHSMLTESDETQFKMLQQRLNSTFDAHKLIEFSYDNDRCVSNSSLSFLKPGVSSEIDVRIVRIKELDNTMQQICAHLNTFLNKKQGTKFIEYNIFKSKASDIEDGDVDDTSSGEDLTKTAIETLSTTEAKGRVLKAKEDEIDTPLCGKLKFIKDKKRCVVTSDKINSICYEIEQIKSSLFKILFSYFQGVCQELLKFSFYPALLHFVAYLDVSKSAALTGLKRKYTRPTIISDFSRSYFKATNLRHPIVERSNDHKFVPNDISFEQTRGIVVYGHNGVGKSVYSKSALVSVVLAQAGLLVPADSYTIAPYEKIVTRLSTHDDLFSRKSSYQIEMEETRTILRNADGNTLVAADELCRGTESQSATALTLAFICELVQRQTSFILSTHLHSVASHPAVLAINPQFLKICHLSTTYDEAAQTLIYDRKIQDGPGESVYGILVARSVGIDANFIAKANKFLQELSNATELCSTRKSHFNSKVYLTSCVECGSKVNLDTHHLEEQSKADPHGFIDHYHKNSKFNLTPLCKTCHVKIHREKKRFVREEGPSEIVIRRVSEDSEESQEDEVSQEDSSSESN